MKKVVVIGGAVMDIFAYPHQKMVLYDSNPGYIIKSFGGVGRNIAENLARLNIDTTLYTVIGKDEIGQSILNHSQTVGLKMVYKAVDQSPTYLSIMDEHHEDLVSVISMDDIVLLNEAFLKRHDKEIDAADIIVMDTNVSEKTLEYMFNRHQKPFYIDAISGQKAIKLKPYLKHIHTLKLNQIEAEVLSDMTFKTMEELTQIGDYFIAQGVEHVFITLGKMGAYYTNKTQGVFRNAAVVKVENGNGAGDAFFSGAIYAALHEKNLLSYGLANAYLNLQSQQSVSRALNEDVLENIVKELK